MRNLYVQPGRLHINRIYTPAEEAGKEQADKICLLSGASLRRKRAKLCFALGRAVDRVCQIGRALNTSLERDTGIEPAFLPWKGSVLPLN